MILIGCFINNKYNNALYWRKKFVRAIEITKRAQIIKFPTLEMYTDETHKLSEMLEKCSTPTEEWVKRYKLFIRRNFINKIKHACRCPILILCGKGEADYKIQTFTLVSHQFRKEC